MLDYYIGEEFLNVCRNHFYLGNFSPETSDLIADLHVHSVWWLLMDYRNSASQKQLCQNIEDEF